MGYHDPDTREYHLPSGAFGATSDSLPIIGPKGKRGLVRDIEWNLTADAVGTTTVPELAVGSAAGVPGTLLNEYARVRLGSTAILGYTTANSPKSASQIIGNVGTVFGKAKADFAGHAQLATAYIPADTTVFFSRVAGAGGSPAGTGAAKAIIDWF